MLVVLVDYNGSYYDMTVVVIPCLQFGFLPFLTSVSLSFLPVVGLTHQHFPAEGLHCVRLNFPFCLHFGTKTFGFDFLNFIRRCRRFMHLLDFTDTEEGDVTK